MRYTTIFLATTFTTAIVYFSSALALAPAPVPAEYWVREMMVIKHSIVKKYAGYKKIIIASGSSSLFDIDAKKLSDNLKIPVINFGLHAGLPLNTILGAAGSDAEKGDVIILPLEPSYYCRGKEPTAWQVRNAIAWDRPRWESWSLLQQLRGISLLEPTFIWELAKARFDEKFRPEAIDHRLVALNDRVILAKFKVRPKPTKFAYSAFNLDSFGDMQKNNGAEYEGIPGYSADMKTEFCPGSWKLLESFKSNMASKGIAVYFANTPYVATNKLDEAKVEAASQLFNEKLSRLAPVLDTRPQLVFQRNLFFNTALHLNAEGRKIRTRILINSIRNNSSLLAHIESK